MKPGERMHENPDRRDSARREDPVVKELRFDRVTKEGKTEECSEKPERGPEQEQAEGTRKGTQQSEKAIGRSLSES